jgi:hypothetical protein
MTHIAGDVSSMIKWRPHPQDNFEDSRLVLAVKYTQ